MVAQKRIESMNPGPFGGDMLELPLLLPGWQAEALEQMAHAEGVTVGQLLRRLVQQALTQPPHRQTGLAPDAP